MPDFFMLQKKFIILWLWHRCGRTFHPHIWSSFIAERTVEPWIFNTKNNYFLLAVRQRCIRYLYHCHRLQPVDRVRYIPLGLVAHVLSDDFFLVGNTEQYRAAFSVKESAKRFHATLQLSGGFLELHPSAFFFGYQPFYYVEVVYAHIQFCKVGTKIVLFAGFRANR